MYPRPETVEVTTAMDALLRALPWLLLSLVLHLPLVYWMTTSQKPPSRLWRSLNIALVEVRTEHGNKATSSSRHDPKKETHREETLTPTKQTRFPSSEIEQSERPVKVSPSPEHSARTHNTAGEKSREPSPGKQAPDTDLSATDNSPHNQQPIRDKLLATLRLELASHFHYPSMAKRRGWQGEVVLSFELKPDGTILNAHIAKSSGYSILDQAALRALDKLHGVKHSLHDALALQLPVTYRLEG